MNLYGPLRVRDLAWGKMANALPRWAKHHVEPAVPVNSKSVEQASVIEEGIARGSRTVRSVKFAARKASTRGYRPGRR